MGVGGGFAMAFAMARRVGPLDRLQLRGLVRHLSFNFFGGWWQLLMDSCIGMLCSVCYGYALCGSAFPNLFGV